MSDKEFKTLDEQIAILKSRGLKISDEEQAISFLRRNNYYRVSGYSLTTFSPKMQPFKILLTFMNLTMNYVMSF